MNITILGLGYVGCVSSACLAQQGHRVFGVDVNQVKVDLINQGQSPIIEDQIDDIIAEMVQSGRLSATTDTEEAIAQSDVSIICVGTPSHANGSLDLKYVEGVSQQIGHALRQRDGYHVVAARSTMLPGSVEAAVLPHVEEASGKKVGEDFGLCINPEFLREGSAVKDYYNPAFTLIGEWDKRSGDVVAQLYKNIQAPLLRTDIRTAEMEKYVSNAFHALKVGFANEIGVMCKEMGIDSHNVMDIFVQDTNLNISAKYLKPGFAFGGSCLPKDVRAIVHRAKSLDLDLPLMNSILPSNARHIEYAFDLVQQTGKKKVGLLGLSFKPGTDDLRESAIVHLVERLIGKGYDLKIYDKNVAMARIIGANKQYIETVIPHISSLLTSDPDEVLAHAELIIVGHGAPEFAEILKKVEPSQQVIDLERVEHNAPNLNGNYQGICW